MPSEHDGRSLSDSRDATRGEATRPQHSQHGAGHSTAAVPWKHVVAEEAAAAFRDDGFELGVLARHAVLGSVPIVMSVVVP